MSLITLVYDKLKDRQALSDEDISRLLKEETTSYCLASLSVLLLNSDFNDSYLPLFRHIFNADISIFYYVSSVFPDHPAIKHFNSFYSVSSGDADLLKILKNTQNGKELGASNIELLINKCLSDDSIMTFMSIWLMTVTIRGLCLEDTINLTIAMRDTGPTYDYRKNSDLGDRTIVRRYPTGALSEKTALILPSLLVCAADKYNIASPFLVAKSLGFTGGTWDKLSSIPGFTFPYPGEQTINTMKECGVAMTVTHGDLCPADRKMYQLRSETGTVESLELASSSIASKQLAVPADLLLLDVRYGPGAFFKKLNDAEILAKTIRDILNINGIKVEEKYIEMMQPNGSAIGNALEVCEAIAIISGNTSSQWDNRALKEQKEIVLDYFALIISHARGEDFGQIRAKADKMFDNKDIVEGFKKLLSAHKVNAKTIESLLLSPEITLGIPKATLQIKSRKDGVLSRLDQRKLGSIVNHLLGEGANEYSQIRNRRVSGIVLKTRLNDKLKREMPLCDIYIDDEIDKEKFGWLLEEVQSCFIIEN